MKSSKRVLHKYFFDENIFRYHRASGLESIITNFFLCLLVCVGPAHSLINNLVFRKCNIECTYKIQRVSILRGSRVIGEGACTMGHFWVNKVQKWEFLNRFDGPFWVQLWVSVSDSELKISAQTYPLSRFEVSHYLPSKHSTIVQLVLSWTLFESLEGFDVQHWKKKWSLVWNSSLFGKFKIFIVQPNTRVWHGINPTLSWMHLWETPRVPRTGTT